MLYPVYTETTNCRDCYKCVRTCPVKAIQIKDGSAVIIKERCIFCGRCVAVCPNNAKKIRNDLSRAKILMGTKDKVICSLAPSFASEYEGKEEKVLAALKRLGFAAVSETAIGAAFVSAAIDRYAKEHDGKCPWVSTACPSVVELVKKYYPQDLEYLAKVPSPLQTHCAYLRKTYGEDIGIIFIGPCVAKKNEADIAPGYPDIALTWDEFATWMKDEGFSLDDADPADALPFSPAKAGVSAFYPVENGQIVTSELWGKGAFCQDAVPLSGMGEIGQVFTKLDPSMPFLELLSCEGGCINGPVGNKSVSLAERKSAVVRFTRSRLASGEKLFTPDEDFVTEVLEKGYGLLKTVIPQESVSFSRHFTEEEIAQALLELGKTSKEDELNCGGCGYNTCRDMAVAYLSGMAEAEMCVTKMRKEAQSKVDVLLRTIPNAIVIVNKDLNIADCNLNFLRIFGDMDEAILDESMLSLVNGLPLERFVPFYQKFSDEFYAQKRNQYRLHYKDKFLRVTFFLVEAGRLLGAMFEDITNPTVRRETVVKKAEDVIQKSLETVQQIASLLGENAAETEIMLNSMIDAFSVHNENTGDGFTLDEDQEQ